MKACERASAYPATNYTHPILPFLLAFYSSISVSVKANFQARVFLPVPASVNSLKPTVIHTIMIRHCFAQRPVNVNTLPGYVILIFHSLETSRPAIQT